MFGYPQYPQQYPQYPQYPQPNQLSSNTSYYSYSSEPDSEFKEIARNADFEHLLRVLDEHMKAIEAMYPREYRSVLRKIKEGA